PTGSSQSNTAARRWSGSRAAGWSRSPAPATGRSSTTPPGLTPSESASSSRPSRTSSTSSTCARCCAAGPPALTTARGPRPRPASSGELPQPLSLRELLQLLQRVVLDLAAPLPGDPERPPALLQSQRLVAPQAIPQLDHLALALG